MKEEIQRWIILPDMQVPYHDTRSLEAVEKYMAAHKWDGYLNLGDFLDFNELSTYVKARPGAVKEDVAQTFAVGREILQRHARILRTRNVDARMVLLQGNHDYRAVRYAEEHPGLKGQLDVPKNLGLEELDIEWIKSWEDGKLFKLGNAHFTHGLLVGKYAAARMVDHYGVCIYFGHTHSVEFHPKVRHGKDQTLEGGALGCLCKYNQQYLKGSPTNWQQAVSTLFLRPGGNYNLYVSRIFNHTFTAPDGATHTG
jgi:predicted phosphodiesterase